MRSKQQIDRWLRLLVCDLLVVAKAYLPAAVMSDPRYIGFLTEGGATYLYPFDFYLYSICIYLCLSHGARQGLRGKCLGAPIRTPHPGPAAAPIYASALGTVAVHQHPEWLAPSPPGTLAPQPRSCPVPIVAASTA